jgi:uncharacterized membrane protein YedE/YeeE
MSFLPLQACIGGAFIGTACGFYMLTAGKIAGNSGALKALVLGPREPRHLAFVFGLLGGGKEMGRAMPSLFDAPPPASLTLGIAGVCVGLGVSLGNGCTSGHGLCGLSRLSMRSLVAVPTFMLVAIAVATLRSGSTYGGFLPIGTTPDAVLELASKLALAIALALLPAFALPRKSTARETYAGLWSGACFAVGLSIGGMVRPSVITNALSPAKIGESPPLHLLAPTLA